MKRFCKDCKYHTSYDYGNWDYCKAFPNLMFSAMKPYVRIPECESVNKDNDCDAFQQKEKKLTLFKRIIRKMVK